MMHPLSRQPPRDEREAVAMLQEALDLLRLALGTETVPAAERRRHHGKWCAGLDSFAARAAACAEARLFVPRHPDRLVEMAAEIERGRARLVLLLEGRREVRALLDEIGGTLARDRAGLYEVACKVLRRAEHDHDDPALDGAVRPLLRDHIDRMRRVRDRNNRRVSEGQRRRHARARAATGAALAEDPPSAGPPPPALAGPGEWAADLLRRMLAAGPMPASAVQHAAREAGIGQCTLREAKHRLGVHTRKVGAVWYWYFAEG